MSSSDHGHIEPRARGEIVSDAATVDARKAIKIEERITIDRSRDELFRIWRNFEHLPNYANAPEPVPALAAAGPPWLGRPPGGNPAGGDPGWGTGFPGEL